jgi:hypothetical protein
VRIHSPILVPASAGLLRGSTTVKVPSGAFYLSTCLLVAALKPGSLYVVGRKAKASCLNSHLGYRD